VLILADGTLRVGGYQVIAVDQSDFSGVRAPFVLQLGPFQPNAAINPAFLPLSPSGIALVSRG
jgi:hypothetical protein